MDWWVNNTLKNDRYTPTIYQEELNQLGQDGCGRYYVKEVQEKSETPKEKATETPSGTDLEPDRNRAGTNLEPQHNRTKQNIEEISEAKKTKETKKKGRAKPSSALFVAPSVEEVRRYCLERGNQVDAQRFVDYYSACDWKRHKTQIRDWKACVRTWESKEKDLGSAGTLLTRASYIPPEDTCPGWMEA
jgi:hypothetical protein